MGIHEDAVADDAEDAQRLPGDARPSSESFGAFCSVDTCADVKDFLAKNSVPAVARAAQQAVERIENCVALDMRQSKPFAAWLARMVKH